ncbi:hypothetical protein J2S43_002055 [Catenuloplanes nepalensis]|uniref:Secreted protein n=1 Tax=Catenuloplanes nepalensis TaxID=587533 RepID=A0ABT9MQ59_9ACTN|nr:hypothetical protein [Catenuloplanes nepalensis]MDP9793543.1 hypothetical protein [Catenuloplanes nepalensis]
MSTMVRWLARTTAVTALLLAGAGAVSAGPASAAAASAGPASADPAGRVFFGPPPASAQLSTLDPLDANTPTMSPAPRRVYNAADGSEWICPVENLCVAVWDPTQSNWKVFDLYTCNRYYFSYWDGDGLYLDRQTAGTVSSVYNQSGGVLHTFTPDYPTVHVYNWSPAWSIRNC